MNKVEEVIQLVLETLDNSTGVEEFSKEEYLSILEELHNEIGARINAIEESEEDELD